MRVHQTKRQRRFWAASFTISLGLVLAACGQESEGTLEELNGELGQLEEAFRLGADQKAKACVSYASICERAASICLWIDEGPLVARCGAIARRCERNLSQNCNRPSPWPALDAGHAADSGPLWPDSAYRPDIGSAYDAGLPDDSGAAGDGASAADAGSASDGGRYPDAGDGCYVGGCSGELCTDRPGLASACIWKPEFDCVKFTKCERQPNGRCGWTPNAAMKACLEAAPNDCRVTGCKDNEKCEVCWFTYACLPPNAVC